MAELFDESHYFICSNGLSPARIQTNIQTEVKRDDDNHYLTENSLICLKTDFKCKFVAVICALIAALIVLLACNPAGWVILAALGAAMAGAAVGSIFAGMLCGNKAAIARSWIVKKLFTQIEGQKMVANRPSNHLTCQVLGGQIFYAPNIKCELDATILFVMNVGFAGLEGFMYAYALRGIGLLVTKPMAFVSNMATNFLRSISPTGLLVRAGFGALSSKHADLSSRTEGGTDKERSDAFWNAALFDAKAMQRLIEFNYRDEDGNFDTMGLIRDLSVPLSLGGIPAGAKGQDATPADALKAWENNAAQYRKIIETAKEFRSKLRGQKNGTGAHEEKIEIPPEKMTGKRPAKPEYPTVDENGNITEYGKWYYERPSGYREGVRDRAWENAGKESIDGNVRDPKTGEIMNPDEPWDMGHKPGYEFRKHQQSAAERGISREQFLDEHNNPKHYRPETPATNRGHSEEAPDDIYKGP